MLLELCSELLFDSFSWACDERPAQGGTGDFEEVFAFLRLGDGE